MQLYAIVAVSITSAPLIKVNLGQNVTQSSLVISVAASGSPVAGSKVRLLNASGKEQGRFVTNSKGYAVPKKKPRSKDYEVKLSSGNYKLLVTKDGYLPHSSKVYLGEDDFVEAIIPLEPSNHRPVPVPGPTDYTNPRLSLWLDGSASHDPDADKEDKTKGIVEYSWELSGKPSASHLRWGPVNRARAKFTPDKPGEYHFNLSVFDGELEQTKEKVIFAGTPYSVGAPVPIQIGGHKVTRIDNRVYLTGGWNDGYSNRLFIYDLEHDHWSEGPPMQVARNHHAAVALGGKLYVIGGHNKKQPQGITTMEIYDPITNRWSLGPSLPTARYSLTANSWHGLIYALGGIGGGKVMEIYHPKTKSWEKGPPLPTARLRHTSRLVGDTLYVIGGQHTESRITSYDMIKQVWSQEPDMPTGRYYLDAVVMRKKIYVIGGHGASGGEPLVEVYNPATQTWTSKNPLPFALDIHSSTVYKNKIFIFGGERKFGASKTVDDTFIYDPRFDIRHIQAKKTIAPEPS